MTNDPLPESLGASHADRQGAVGSTGALAWHVEIDSSSCVVFAATKAKAQWIATKSYWNAGYGRHKVWPRAKAFRAERHDQSVLRFMQPRAWIEEYVNEQPRQANEPSSGAAGQKAPASTQTANPPSPAAHG